MHLCWQVILPFTLAQYEITYSNSVPRSVLFFFKLNVNTNYCFHHSRIKRKDSLETWAVLIKTSMLCWNLPSSPKYRVSLQKKNITFPEGNNLVVDFRVNLDKKTLIWFNLQRDGTGNGLSNIKDTFAESLQLQMSVLHQSMSIFKAGLKFIWWLGKI